MYNLIILYNYRFDMLVTTSQQLLPSSNVTPIPKMIWGKNNNTCIDPTLRPSDAYGQPINGVFMRETTKNSEDNVELLLSTFEQQVYNSKNSGRSISENLNFCCKISQEKWHTSYVTGEITRNTYNKLKETLEHYQKDPEKNAEAIIARAQKFYRDIIQLQKLLRTSSHPDEDANDFIAILDNYSKSKQRVLLNILWKTDRKTLLIKMAGVSTPSNIFKLFLETCNSQANVGLSNDDSLLHMVRTYDNIILLLEHGYDINKTLEKYWNNSPLHMGIINEDLNWCKKFFDAARVTKSAIDFTIEDSNGNNHLQLAVRINSPAMVQLVIDNIPVKLRKTIINHVNSKTQRAPLHDACLVANEEIVKILLQNGADPNIPDANGNTPLHKVVTTNKNKINNHLKKVAIAGERDIQASSNVLLGNKQKEIFTASDDMLEAAHIEPMEIRYPTYVRGMPKPSNGMHYILWSKSNIEKIKQEILNLQLKAQLYPQQADAFESWIQALENVIQNSPVTGISVIEQAMSERVLVVKQLLDHGAILQTNKRKKTPLDYLQTSLKKTPNFFQQNEDSQIINKIKLLLEQSQNNWKCNIL